MDIMKLLICLANSANGFAINAKQLILAVPAEEIESYLIANAHQEPGMTENLKLALFAITSAKPAKSKLPLLSQLS